MKAKNILFAAAISSAVLCACDGLTSFTSVKQRDTVVFTADSQTIMFNETPYEAEAAPLIYKGYVYVPIDGALQACGNTTYFDENTQTFSVTKGDKKMSVCVDGTVKDEDGERHFTPPPFVYHGITYATPDMIEKIAGVQAELEGEFTEIPMDRRDLMDTTEVTDEYRPANASISKYNSIYIVNNERGMELLSVSGPPVFDYAAIMNSFAKSLPDANVYCMAVPTACEFYAPKQIYTNQLGGIRSIYSALDDGVMPINVVKPLMEHAGEKIYFNTDHHWTQRGAYYAYCAFADNKGFIMPPLNAYETKNVDGMVGSLRTFADGTPGADILNSCAELLEKFMPRFNCTGVAYYDMDMEKKICDFPVINEYATGYSGTFIGGDSPLAVISTDNNSGRKLVIIKESFGTAFSTWAAEHYSQIYVVDPRLFNGFDNNNEPFTLRGFYEKTHFDDLLVINYPGSISSGNYRDSLKKMAE